MMTWRQACATLEWNWMRNCCCRCFDSWALQQVSWHVPILRTASQSVSQCRRLETLRSWIMCTVEKKRWQDKHTMQMSCRNICTFVFRQMSPLIRYRWSFLPSYPPSVLPTCLPTYPPIHPLPNLPTHYAAVVIAGARARFEPDIIKQDVAHHGTHHKLACLLSPVEASHQPGWSVGGDT